MRPRLALWSEPVEWQMKRRYTGNTAVRLEDRGKRLIGQDKEKQMKKFSDSIVLVALRCGTWLRDRLSCCAAEVLLVQTGI